MCIQPVQLLKICKKKDPSLSKYYLIYIREYSDDIPHSYDDNIGGHTWLCKFDFSNEEKNLVVDVFMHSHDGEYQDVYYGLEDITFSCFFRFDMTIKCLEILKDKYEKTDNKSKRRFKLLGNAIDSLELAIALWDDVM